MDDRESAESTNLPSLSELEELQLIPPFPRSNRTVQDILVSPLTSDKCPSNIHSEPRRLIPSNPVPLRILSSPPTTSFANRIESMHQIRSSSWSPDQWRYQQPAQRNDAHQLAGPSGEPRSWARSPPLVEGPNYPRNPSHQTPKRASQEPPSTPKPKTFSADARMKKAKKNHLQGSSTNQIPRLLPKKITKFEDIPAHTAKCDTCNRRNSKGMTRCGDCGWQLCQSCRQQRGGDLTHRTFSSEHTEAPEARSPVSVPEASATPEISTVSNMSPYGIEPTEEDAAEILVKIQSSSSPAVRSCSEEEESIPTPTPMPRSRGYSSRPQDRADDSDDTIFMHSSQERHEEDSPEIYLEDIVRRNPFRRARPGRNDFVQADPRVV